MVFSNHEDTHLGIGTHAVLCMRVLLLVLTDTVWCFTGTVWC